MDFMWFVSLNGKCINYKIKAMPIIVKNYKPLCYCLLFFAMFCFLSFEIFMKLKVGVFHQKKNCEVLLGDRS